MAGRHVVPLPSIREADVMWCKRVWRIIPLDEKINLPLKYPSTHSTRDRLNLIDVIHDAAMEGTLTVYKSYSNGGGDDEFTTPLSQIEVAAIEEGGDTTDVVDPTTLETTRKWVPRHFERDRVYKWRIKEDWFFDKQRSVMDVRIIGIAPMVQVVSLETGESKGDKELYWVYFPEARNILVNHEVFNRFNDAERRSFDDIFMKRMFSSYITKEANVFDRTVSTYKTNPLDALLEAEKIKQDIFNMEHDVWEY